jgi:hypothetical protein
MLAKIVYLIPDQLFQSKEKDLDAQGFYLLATDPDKDDTLPTKRVSDGQYACLPVWAITDTSPNIRGSFQFVNGEFQLFNIETLSS